MRSETTSEQINMKRGAVAMAQHRVTTRVSHDLTERLAKEIE